MAAVTVALLVSSLPPARGVNVPPGPLDPSFGNDGLVVTPIGPAGTLDVALGMAMQDDGRFVLVGNSGGGGSFGTGGRFAVALYEADGDLDPSFGGDGKVTTDVTAEEGKADEAHAVAIQPDGKVVAVGVAETAGTFTDFAVLRYNPDGTLDPTFGDGGIELTDVTADFGPDFSNAWAVAIQPDGKIVVAGEIEYSYGFALARYNPDGSIDDTFGEDGTVVTEFCTDDLCQPGVAYALALQPDGKIVAAGGAQTDAGGPFDSFFALARYLPDGNLDSSFGNDGKVTTPFGSGFPNVEAHALVLQPDGKLVAAGNALVNGQFDRFGVVRYNTDGSLDSTFGDGGKVKTSVSPINNGSTALGLARMNDGRLVAVGSAVNEYRFEGNSYFHQDLAVVRYRTDGNLDTSFSGDGMAATAISDGYHDLARAVAIQPGQRIVVGGYADVGVTFYDFDFALVRYMEDQTPPDTAITSGPTGSTRDRTPTFRFKAVGDPGARWFRCRLDARPYKWCRSPLTTRVSKGRHVFQVVALDEAGNPDPSPARRAFKVAQ